MTQQQVANSNIVALLATYGSQETRPNERLADFTYTKALG